MKISDLVHPTNQPTTQHHANGSPASTPKSTPVTTHSPIAETLAPGAAPGLPIPTHRLQQRLESQLSVPAFYTIPPTEAPPRSQQPPVEIATARSAVITLPTTIGPIPLRMIPAELAERVRATAADFHKLWLNGEWAAAHEQLRLLGKTYPKCGPIELLPELSEANKAIGKLKTVVGCFLRGSGHYHCNSTPASAWKRVLRYQTASGQDASSMDNVVTNDAMRQATPQTMPAAIKGTMVHLSWLLPDWKLMGGTTQQHEKRIAKALGLLFKRLDEIHKEWQRSSPPDELLPHVLNAVKPGYCSPQLRATLKSFSDVPDWLKEPLHLHLDSIAKDKGAELFPPNELPQVHHAIESPARVIQGVNATPNGGGTKRSHDEMRRDSASDEPAPQYMRSDAPPHMPPGHGPRSAFTRPRPLASTPFVIPGIETRNAPPESPTRSLLKAIESQQIAAVELALMQPGAWTNRALALAQSMAGSRNNNMAYTILQSLTNATPAAGAVSEEADPRNQDT
ncbi:hypothetical protein [Hydrogenophaga sp. BPS33]|uniref:hypothetical protein n=1 Tax=Hydrogenophaga sp. BPS33 TaxID=2651974 RepID=UPI0013204EE2|nr:hypothetical protein [Hydrogenophaga sp. BPS33]QHE86954.1 hypothetical protein F9K07_19640 [Hydrogenophaga sp. BPS33]